MKPTILFALGVVSLAVPAFAAAPADVMRDLRTPSLGGAAAVSNVAITIGHLKLSLAAGSAAKLLAGGEPVGLFFKGTGSFEYVAEATELPLVVRNVKTDSKAKVSGATISDDLAEVLIFSAGEALPTVGDSGGAALADAFKAHQSVFDRAQIDRPSHKIGPVKFGLPGKALVAEIVTPRDNLVYTFDSADAQEESLVSLHPISGYVGDKTVEQWLVGTTLSSQPVGRDVKTYAKPPFTITALDYTLVADGDNAKLEISETIAPRVAGQQALRFSLTNNLFMGAGKPRRNVNLRSVTDERGHALSFDHDMDDLLLLLAAPASQPFKLKFVIDGDFLIRESGDNAWQLVNFSWFPRTNTLAGGYFTVHSLVKVKKPFIPIVPGDTVVRKEDGDYNVVENVIDKPINFPNVHAGKYTVIEEKRGDLTVRVATYALRNEKGAKTLINLAYGFINDYEVFLGPFPWKEFNIVQVNTYGYGQAPPATMFITNEAFNPIRPSDEEGTISAERYFSQGINERFAHEIAHQYWFTVVKIPNIEENWLSESFAEMSAAMTIKRLRGDAYFNRLVSTWRGRANESASIAPIPYVSRIGGDRSLAFANRIYILYNKGPLLLETIRKQLGDEKFLIFLKSYQKSFAWKFGTTKDVAGLLGFMTKQDWNPFFDQYYWGLQIPQ
jgi:hypothetical protein